MIPRLIHRIWVGGPTPDGVVKLGTAWASMHPGWEVRLWQEGDLPADMLASARAVANSPAQACDVLRLELLHRWGGVYLDADFEPLRPLDGLVAGVECFAASEDGRWISTGIMGAAPGHPFIAALLTAVHASIAAAPDAPPNETSGPKFVTRGWARYRRDHPQAPVAVFPPALFYPYHFTEPDRAGETFPAAYAVHRWSSSWTAGPPAPSNLSPSGGS